MNQLDVQVEVMRAAGLQDDEILRLAHLRHRVAAGTCDDLTTDYKRVMFLKYLYDHGHLREWAVAATRTVASEPPSESPEQSL